MKIIRETALSARTDGLLPRVKGTLVGLQWALRMHGFGTGPDPADPLPDPAANFLEPKGRHV